MEAKELRIGNLVNTPKGVDVITVVTIDNIIETKNQSTYYPEPIPLTEEWLIKFGFDKDGKIRGTGFLFRICFDEKTPYAYLETYGGGEYKIDIKYVHQLQNLYFALTGGELECKI